MTDKPLQEPPAQNGDTEKLPDWAKDPNRVVEIVTELRSENKDRRLQVSDLETKLNSILERLPANEETDESDKNADPIQVLESRLEKIDKLFQDEVKRREQAERSALVTRIASAAGLPDALASRLQGTTEDELIADAQALAELLPKKEAQPEGNQRGIFRTTTTVPGGQVSSGQKEDEMRARLFGRQPAKKPDVQNGRITNW